MVLAVVVGATVGIVSDLPRSATESVSPRNEKNEIHDFFVQPRAMHEKRSFDDVYERRGPRGYEEEREHYEERDYYDQPRFQREREAELGRQRSTTITMERERERERDDSPTTSKSRWETSLFEETEFPRYI
ncbi:hypothetical protein EYC84_007030 [Monilinia fructicola]|uniref:Uncharacterized protein n=1 Tax=Monilinia fructicola TaxID=38448 RepID=A0A5M9KDH2_MONFR|nr:hypothetical protein EYC84_007030 [Monilinia fructicola]